mgnify:CR=1 FL=1
MLKKSASLLLIVSLSFTTSLWARSGWFTAIGDTEADNLFLQARAAFADGQFQKAKKLLTPLRAQPMDYQIDVLLMLERIYGYERNHDEALRCLQECTKLCNRLNNIELKVIQRLVEVRGMEGHALGLARQLVINEPKSLPGLQKSLDSKLYWPLAILATAAEVTSVPTTPQLFDERWQIMQSFLLSAPKVVRHRYLPTYASLVELRKSKGRRMSSAAQKLDEIYFKVRSFIIKHLYSPTLHRSPRPEENPFFPYVIVGVSNINELVMEAPEKETNTENYEKRWKVLRSYIVSLPAKVRSKELFTFSRLVQNKLRFYRDPKSACKELDELIGKVKDQRH